MEEHEEQVVSEFLTNLHGYVDPYEFVKKLANEDLSWREILDLVEDNLNGATIRYWYDEEYTKSLQVCKEEILAVTRGLWEKFCKQEE